MSARVLVTIVTHNSSLYLRPCLESLQAQTCRDTAVSLWDNASEDRTIEIAASFGRFVHETHFSTSNVGFCAAHNRLISETECDYVLVLNPDVILSPRFVEIMVETMNLHPEAGSASGKLWRWQGAPGSRPPEGASADSSIDADGKILDTTGIFFTRNQRHLDRGSGERDTGQYEKLEYVFGASGAAAFYRRRMLEEIKAGEEYFDESFFAYREDADLSWRAQWMGWRCLYVPQATAYHVRRVLPERRAQLPAQINMHSLKNRFLLRVKNLDAGTYIRLFIPITARDLAAFAHILLRERSSLRAIPLFLRSFRKAWAVRKALQHHRRISPHEIRSWFSNTPVSKPLECGDGRSVRRRDSID